MLEKNKKQNRNTLAKRVADKRKKKETKKQRNGERWTEIA